MIDVFRRRMQGERSVLARVHLPAFEQGGVQACVCTVGGDLLSLCPLGLDEPYGSAIAMLDALRDDVAESDGRLEVASSASEIAGCLERDVVALVPALEGAMPLKGEIRLIEDLYERGVRVIGLTWNSRNELATGVGAGTGGLTPAGVRAIGVMNRLGILIDLAHASEDTFWDAVRETSAPVFVSHANARTLCDHPRNLDDSQLDAVAASGGAVGLVFFPSFVGPQPVDLEAVLEHADYIAGRLGTGSIVIGADFVDFAVEEMARDLRAHGDLYDEDALRFPRGIESVASMQNVVAGLGRHGFTENAVAKVASANFLRVFAETERAAA
jgi:membrane dipeptidase